MSIEENQIEQTDVALEDDDFEVIVDDEADGEAPVESEGGEIGEAKPIEPETPAEAEPVEAESHEDEDLDEEVKGYSKQVQKRIFREIRLRKKVEEEANQLKVVVSKAAEAVKSKDNELAQVRERMYQLELNHVAVLDHAFDTQITLKAKELRAARENGNYDDELKLQGELDQLRFQQNQVREAKRGMESRPAPKADAAPQQAAKQQAQASAPQVNPVAQKWLAKNQSWFNNPKFAAHKQFTLAVDAQLTAEGYNQQTDDYFAELDRRVDEAFPTLRKKPAVAKPTTPPVAGAVQAAPSSNKNAVRLTRADLDLMSKFGLDPKNKEHLREFAKSKRASGQ